MAQQTIKTAIEIAAPPSVIWEVLTNFTAYKDWNPFLTSVEGDVAVGNKIKINASGMQFKPKVLVFDKNKELRWIGHLFFKGVFDGEHSFEIIDHGGATSTFNHEEQFTGILVGLFANKIQTDFKASFEEMNAQLKVLAEAQYAAQKKSVSYI